MKNFIKLIIIIFVSSNISNLFAITVFDKPIEEKSTLSQNTINIEDPSSQKTSKKKCPCPTNKKEVSKNQIIHKNNKSGQQKHTNKSSPTKQIAKAAPIKTSKEKLVKANATAKNTSKEKDIIPNNATKAQEKQLQKLQDTVTTSIGTNVTSLSPLIIVNNFEEDPIFISAVKGVLYSVNKNLDIVDVSNINESKNIISQAYKLLKTSSFWGENTVFISGSYKNKIESSIIIVKTKNNQFFVTQNSGVLTFIEDTIGISEVREIQRVNFDSKTLNGRDVEYLIGAKLIDNPKSFNTMGEPISFDELAKFSYTPLRFSNNTISSLFIVEDKDNGDIFTFIPTKEFAKFKPQENDIFKITLSSGANLILDFEAIYKNSLSYTGGNEAIILEYKNSIGSYIALKNIQGNLPTGISNYKIAITPFQKGDPIDISQIANTDSAATLDEEMTEETGKIYPYVNSTTKEDSTTTPNKETTTETAKVSLYINTPVKEDATATSNEEAPTETAKVSLYISNPIKKDATDTSNKEAPTETAKVSSYINNPIKKDATSYTEEDLQDTNAVN